MIDYQEQFIRWTQSCCAAERRLYETAVAYDTAYFDDMMFVDGSIVTPFLEYEAVQEQGEAQRWCEDVPELLTSITRNHYIFRIRELEEGTRAETSFDERYVMVAPAYAEDKPVLLHELTHAHEDMLAVGPHIFRDIVFYSLLSHVRKLVPDLDNRVLQHGHLIPNWETTMQGGPHSILFYLKSLELDLRCGFPLGTVYGYE